MGGGIAEQPLHFPIFMPKLPGRIYYMFGKPIRTKGKVNMLNDKDYLKELYSQIKCDVESNMAYLLNKREEDPYRVSRDFVKISGASCIEWKSSGVASYDCGGKKSRKNVPQNLEHLWDDGYGTRTMKDYAEISMDLIKSDGGPPRWFCPVACGSPLEDSPLLFYLPGIDGTGAGLVIHEKALGKVYHVQCLHIPVWDRTPLEGLIEIVEEIVMNEHTLSPSKPIYLLGDSFGGSLALAVAARNPTLDLILILANPECYKKIRWYRLFTGTAIFSTMEDGKIVRGLAGIPDEGPVLAVGNHTFWGYDVFSLVPEFMREKKIVLHGLAHPEAYQYRVEDEHIMIPFTNTLKSFGAVPVSARNLYKLLSTKSYALLYPGGARESLHRKGESYKLFWPEKQEFVRMAVKLGATIIPFGAVGEDDLSEQLIDYNDMKNIPFLNDMVNDYNQGRTNVRAEIGGEIAKQPLHVPIFLPKLPGRLYFKFGKPIQTRGKENMLNDKDYMRDLYLQIRRDVEKNIAYLLNKRNEDPYRGIVERFVWHTNYGSLDQVPSFDP
ncbi:diacylglycerol acyltransferase [Artemisia annua]|uniref:Diacylglycerol acyltransferase n=1 Tax=Artemisia annua TaxID=35608 RepID=A0A2U1NUT5_ARTAN|nr:diacylglycerol acyltransferase [Artemisia annua]